MTKGITPRTQWHTGPRTPVWNQLWRSILAEVLSTVDSDLNPSSLEKEIG